MNDETPKKENTDENFGKLKDDTVEWIDIVSLKRIKIPLIRPRLSELIIDMFK